MFFAAAEERGDNLLDGRGDAYCGMLNASYNLKLLPIARAVVGLSSLKIISFGPRPLNFLACNAPIQQLYNLGVEIEKNFPHHGAVAFGNFGKTLYEVFKYVGVPVEEIGYNQPAGVRYPTENPLGIRSEVCMLYIGVDLGTSTSEITVNG